MTGSGDLARLTVVPNVIEAQLICDRLKEAGIPSFHRITDVGFGGTEDPMGGPREILVRAESLGRAKKVLEEV